MKCPVKGCGHTSCTSSWSVFGQFKFSGRRGSCTFPNAEQLFAIWASSPPVLSSICGDHLVPSNRRAHRRGRLSRGPREGRGVGVFLKKYGKNVPLRIRERRCWREIFRPRDEKLARLCASALKIMALRVWQDKRHHVNTPSGQHLPARPHALPLFNSNAYLVGVGNRMEL